jgi:hypothetical protein
MRILILSNLSPIPANSGARLRQYHLLKRIADRHEISYAFHIWDDEDLRGAAELEKYCRNVRVGRVRRRPYIRRVPAMANCLLKGRPPELAFWWSNELAWKIADLVKHNHFDLIQIE